jgi:hypothetical protein
MNAPVLAAMSRESSQSDLASVAESVNGMESSALTANHCSLSLGLFEKLTPELFLHCATHLDTTDIIRLGMTSKGLRREATTDFLWEQLWAMTYGVLWRDERVTELRQGRGIYWDPRQNFGPPLSGWYRFYLAFEAGWLDWILAGYCTREKCVVSIQGALYDVTHFMDEHPGSSETLSEGSGCDATETFFDIGHSSHAENLMRRFCFLDPKTISLTEAARASPIGVGRQVPRHGEIALQNYLRHIQREVVQFADDALPSKQRQVTLLAVEEVSKLIPRTMRRVSVSLPNVSLPNVSLPNVSLPNVSLPNYSLPSVSLPAMPSMPGMPSMSSVSLPSMPSMSSLPLPMPAIMQQIEEMQQHQDVDAEPAEDDVGLSLMPTEEENMIQQTEALHETFTETGEMADVDAAMQIQPAFIAPVIENDERQYQEAREESVVPRRKMKVQLFGPPVPVVKSLSGFFRCPERDRSDGERETEHAGMIKAFFDPLSGEWVAWCSYCGLSYTLLCAPSSVEDTAASWIFV